MTDSPKISVHNISTVRILGRPEWARGGVMAASFLQDGDKTRVIGRGFLRNLPVDKSQLFQAELEGFRKFKLSPEPILSALSDLAVEDPTVTSHPAWSGGETVILYSRVYKFRGRIISDIWWAPVEDTGKRRLLIASDKLRGFPGRVLMVKEPEVLGDLLFYEVADETSRIAVGEIDSKGKITRHRLFLDVRPGQWDGEHVSTGPILSLADGRALMLYNGRGRRAWAIGVLIFDPVTLKVLYRSSEPIITPGQRRGPGGQRIAFASGVLRNQDTLRLYYHEADRAIKVATLSGI